MAHVDEMPQEVLESIASQLSSLIEPAGEEMPESTFLTDAEVTPRLGEYFSIWTLSPRAVASGVKSGRDLLELAQPTGQWHHQIKVDQQSRAFARSITPQMAPSEYQVPTELDPHEPSVLQLTESTLAEKIDAAIDWIDKREQGFAGESEQEKSFCEHALVRLLESPAFRVYALWLINEAAQNSAVLIVDEARIKHRFKPFTFLTSLDFLKALAAERSIDGIA